MYRLLDFWCPNPQAKGNSVPISEWDNLMYLHPQFNNLTSNKYINQCLSNGRIFPMFKNVTLDKESIYKVSI